MKKRGRPPVQKNPKCAERMTFLLANENISQSTLAEETGIAQQHISRIVNGTANITEVTATAINKAYPSYQVWWLMGYNYPPHIIDDFKNYVDSYFKRYEAARVLVECSLSKRGLSFCDWVPVPNKEGYDSSIILVKDEAQHSYSIKSNIAEHILQFVDNEVEQLIKGAASNG